MARRIKEVDVFEELGAKLWDKFDELMKVKGYNVFVDTGEFPGTGRGTTAFKKDRFVPIIKLCYWYHSIDILCGGYISIHVSDRNGNSILTGESVGIYKLDVKATDDLNEIEVRFDKMLEEVVKKYENYSRENRLDFVFNELKEDRQSF